MRERTRVESAVASARSRFGNHSATALLQAGKLAPSEKPRRARQRPNCPGLETVAWKAEARDQTAAATAQGAEALGPQQHVLALHLRKQRGQR